MSSSSAAPAPWRSLFLSHIESMDSPEFTLSTLRRASAGGARGRRPSVLATPLYFPRARTCIFRGLFANMNVNPKNDAPLNPEGVWESDLLTFTTDARMDKMEELGKKTEAPVKSTEEKLKGSGGGAPVEAMFWASKPAVQWRVRGRAYVLAPDIESSSEGREVMTLLKSRMRKPPHTGEEKEWSFAREITAHFGNLSPIMRGSFRNPPPGRPVASPVEPGEGLKLGQKVTDLEDPVARANFRVVVIVPDEIDQADLSDPEHGRRWLHTYVGAGHGKGHGEWETTEVWP
ncbi:FMN-binding split barrel-related protein [Xylaria flabelliformis]|nr:FMN-binding split barrel-related protein [Xylaria flabelliformis]